MASKRAKLLQANQKAVQKNNEKVEESELVSPSGDNLVEQTIKELDQKSIETQEKKVEMPPQASEMNSEASKKDTAVKSKRTEKTILTPKENDTEGLHIILSNDEPSEGKQRKKNKKNNYVGLRITDKAMAAINALVQMNGEETQNWVLNKHFEDLADELNISWERK